MGGCASAGAGQQERLLRIEDPLTELAWVPSQNALIAPSEDGRRVERVDLESSEDGKAPVRAVALRDLGENVTLNPREARLAYIARPESGSITVLDTDSLRVVRGYDTEGTPSYVTLGAQPEVSRPGSEWARFTRKKMPKDKLYDTLDEEESYSSIVSMPGHSQLGLGRHWHFISVIGWLLYGLVYVVLLLATGVWHRFWPYSWEIFPQAVKDIITYLRFELPPTLPGQPYNAIRKLTYGAVVFILAPFQIATGAAQSPALEARFPWYVKLFGGAAVHPRLRHERRAAAHQARRAFEAPIGDPGRLQDGQVDRTHRVRLRLLEHRRGHGRLAGGQRLLRQGRGDLGPCSSAITRVSTKPRRAGCSTGFRNAALLVRPAARLP